MNIKEKEKGSKSGSLVLKAIIKKGNTPTK
jgi:hypothetical protein